MLIVVALGGNALLKHGDPPTAEAQRANVRVAAAALSRIAKGNDLVIVHGNGPQVGMLAKQSDGFPLDVLVAETQGMIGYLIEQEMRRQLPKDRACVALMTMVDVNEDDRAFTHPDKPIGQRYTPAQASCGSIAKEWTTVATGNMVQRVVPSPQPQRILELGPVQWLLAHGCIVICAGGGGIPVADNVDGSTHGVEAVIDKDRTASILAVALNASLLVIATDVPGIYEDWGRTTQHLLAHESPESLSRRHFEAGSMGPKVEAVCDFVKQTGKRAVIGALDEIDAMVEGTAGTSIELQNDMAFAKGP
jgi:carbamate kinase